MKRAVPTLVLALSLVACFVLLGSCKVWGDRDNPADPDGIDYQGYPTVESSADIEPVSPANGGKLKTSSFSITPVGGAVAYELLVAGSKADLDSSPILDKADCSSNSIKLLSDSIITGNTYYWRARARTSSGWDKEWSPVYSFMTDFPYVWTDRSKSATATAGLTWSSIASSSTGQYLATVVSGGYIWTSQDYGTSWIPHSEPGSEDWYSVASSADGKYLAAVPYGGDGLIWTTSDYGASWMHHPATGWQRWDSIASSSDGKYLAAVCNYGYIWTSTDYGASWVSHAGPGMLSWQLISSSSDGKYLVAVEPYDDIWTSSDYGATWISHAAPSNYWSSIASSSDGGHFALVSDHGEIWTSSDHGASWNCRAVYRSGYGIASSSDGRRLAATVAWGDDIIHYGIVISKDYGATWSAEGTEFDYGDAVIASSADLTHLVAAVLSGNIWTAYNATLTE
jgi:hypothetical protein